MVYLSRIYTKTGDQGETSLGDGSRVPKNHPRVAAYGSVDEVNATLGVLLTQQPPPPEGELLRGIQNDLLDVGADLCVPPTDEEKPAERLRVQPAQTRKLEQAIDRLNEQLHPLKSFVIPGANPTEAWCHMARVVCRRAERDVITLAQQEKVNQEAIIYLNRLSDFLFVLARIAHGKDRKEALWEPGKSA